MTETEDEEKVAGEGWDVDPLRPFHEETYNFQPHRESNVEI